MKLLCKKMLILVLIGTLLLSSSCGNSTRPEETEHSLTESNQSKNEENISDKMTTDFGGDDKGADSKDTEIDTDIGLKNIKIDSTEQDLTEQQKMVLKYFDDDYLTVPSYEFLRRYPLVFDGAQLTIWGTVKKVISMNADSYEVILWLDVGPVEYEYSSEYPEYEGDYIYLTGKTATAWFMEGDTLQVYGRYMGVKSVDVDGISYTIPQINVHQAYFDTSEAPNDIFRYIEKFSFEYIEEVAKIIFGDSIEVRWPIAGTDLEEDIYLLQMSKTNYEKPLCYVVELEDQSNAKFSKYFFAAGTDAPVVGGRITDAKDALNYSGIERYIEFAADFSHFFLFTYDTNLEKLVLEYYDNALNKIWKRDFSETTSARYDYTKNNIYLVANNELYIINIETGQNAFTPSYVGEKIMIRKLRDGILMISPNKSDGVIKVDLEGNIIWATNLEEDTFSVEGVQIIDGRIVFDQYYWDAVGDNGTHYIVLDDSNGEIIIDAVSLNE